MIRIAITQAAFDAIAAQIIRLIGVGRFPARASCSKAFPAHPARTLWFEARKRERERVRCSSLVDWPVYPRLRPIMPGQSVRAMQTDAIPNAFKA
jgi:hypothetical protein